VPCSPLAQPGRYATLRVAGSLERANWHRLFEGLKKEQNKFKKPPFFEKQHTNNSLGWGALISTSSFSVRYSSLGEVEPAVLRSVERVNKI